MFVHLHKLLFAMQFHRFQTLFIIILHKILSSSFIPLRRGMYGSACVNLSSSSSTFWTPGGTICFALPEFSMHAFKWAQFSGLFNSVYPGSAASSAKSISRSIIVINLRNTVFGFFVDSFRDNHSRSSDSSDLGTN